MAKIEGGCLCGAVRYTSDADPVATAICHCKNCQRQSGSAFSVIIGIPRASFSLQGDPMKSYEDRGESGQPVLRQFCGNCGSPVVSDVAVTPDLLWIKTGTLDDPSQLHPQMHIWTDHQQPWVDVAQELPKISRNPPAE